MHIKNNVLVYNKMIIQREIKIILCVHALKCIQYLKNILNLNSLCDSYLKPIPCVCMDGWIDRWIDREIDGVKIKNRVRVGIFLSLYQAVLV